MAKWMKQKNGVTSKQHKNIKQAAKCQEIEQKVNAALA